MILERMPVSPQGALWGLHVKMHIILVASLLGATWLGRHMIFEKPVILLILFSSLGLHGYKSSSPVVRRWTPPVASFTATILLMILLPPGGQKATKVDNRLVLLSLGSHQTLLGTLAEEVLEVFDGDIVQVAHIPGLR